MTTAAQLRAAAKRHGLTIAEIARRSGVPYQRLIRVSNGYQAPSNATRRAIADALGERVEEVWG